MPRTTSAKTRTSAPESVLDLIPRVGRSVQAERKELQALAPQLSGGLAQAAQENLKASEAALKALAGLGDVVRDQADLLAIARRRKGAQAGSPAAGGSGGTRPAGAGGPAAAGESR